MRRVVRLGHHCHFSSLLFIIHNKIIAKIGDWSPISIDSTPDSFKNMFQFTFQPTRQSWPGSTPEKSIGSSVSDPAMPPTCVCCKVRVAIMRMPRRRKDQRPARRRRPPPRPRQPAQLAHAAFRAPGNSSDAAARAPAELIPNGGKGRPRLQCVSDRRRGNSVVVDVEQNDRNL